MSEFFLTIINMSISASWIVLAVLLLRLLLKKAPKWVTVLLWGIVAIRLVCPFSFESVLSLIPSAETIDPDIIMNKTPEINMGISSINNIINPIINSVFAPSPETSANPLQIWIPILSVAWIAGITILLAYTIISYWRVRSKVKTAVLLRDNIYECETVVSPFVLGVIKPKIYLPFNMSEQDEEYVIAHEQAHIHRKDHLWKPFGFLILTIHWFNPLMWLGYVLLCRDIELACDEKVVKKLNIDGRANYSEALLSCSVNRRMIAACPLAFGEVGVKARVKSVLNYKKPAFWIMMVAIIALVVTSVCLLTNPKSKNINNLDDRLKVFLDMQVSEHNGSNESRGNYITVSYDLMKVDESHSEISVYAWILYMEYSCEDGVLTEESGTHIPTVITAKKNGNKYELIEYWTPRRDDSYWADDVKDKFPRYLWSKALDSQQSIDKQNAECEQMAKEYFGISETTVGGVSVPESIVSTNNAYKFKSDKDMATLSLSAIDNTGSFMYSVFSSYMAYGTYEDDGNYIVLKTDDGRFKYTFKRENDTLVFVASKSSAMPRYAYSAGAKTEVCLPDRATFEKVEPIFVNSIDTIVFDIDKDGKNETCVLGYGPTSGLFTFTLTVGENGKTEYFNIFHSPTFYHLSFDAQEDKLRLKGMTQGDKPTTEYFDFVIEDGNISLASDVQKIGYWGEQGLESPYAPKGEIDLRQQKIG